MRVKLFEHFFDSIFQQNVGIDLINVIRVDLFEDLT